MTEIKDLDIFGLKPVAKALEKVAVNTVDGLGSFFGALCMPAADEFGLLLKDKVTAYRLKNLEKIAAETKNRINSQGIQLSGQSNPVLVKEVLTEASWTADENIQKMWAGLLAVAAGNTTAADDSLVYTDILKRLTPFQARLVNEIYGDPRCCSVKTPVHDHTTRFFQPLNALVYSAVDILEIYPGDLEEIVPIANMSHDEILSDEKQHSIACSRFKPQILALQYSGLINTVNFGTDMKRIMGVEPSFKGLDFYMRCLGYSVYPLEAFLVTQQHWNRKKGIDPFSYRKSD